MVITIPNLHKIRTHFRSRWLRRVAMKVGMISMLFNNIIKTSRLNKEKPNSNSHLVAERAFEINTTSTKYKGLKIFRKTHLMHSSSRVFQASRSSHLASDSQRKVALSRSQTKTIGEAHPKALNQWTMLWLLVGVKALSKLDTHKFNSKKMIKVELRSCYLRNNSSSYQSQIDHQI
jgi:hypothetical protein